MFPELCMKGPKSWETFTTWQLYTFLNDLDIWHWPFSMRKSQRSQCKLSRVSTTSRFHIFKFSRYQSTDAQLLVRPRTYFYQPDRDYIIHHEQLRISNNRSLSNLIKLYMYDIVMWTFCTLCNRVTPLCSSDQVWRWSIIITSKSKRYCLLNY